MVRVVITDDLLSRIRNFGKAGYPEEVAALVFGVVNGNDEVVIRDFFTVVNNHEAGMRYHRYQISSDDWMKGEAAATQLMLHTVGVFHTHPDHPSEPSQIDLEYAFPNLIYLIAAVYSGTVTSIQAWKLREDRTQFDQCLLQAT